MALTATVYNFRVSLSDIDRGVYDDFDMRVARQPSETIENTVLRALAFCLEWCPGIAFTEGVAAGSEPAILVRDLTGRIVRWIEVGNPPPERLHRGMKAAGSAVVYTCGDPRRLIAALEAAALYRAADIPVRAFDAGFIAAMTAKMERRSELSLSVTEQVVYMSIGGADLTTSLAEWHLTG